MDTHKQLFLVATLALTWPLLTSCQSVNLTQSFASLDCNITCNVANLTIVSNIKMSLNFSSSELAYFNQSSSQKFDFHQVVNATVNVASGNYNNSSTNLTDFSFIIHKDKLKYGNYFCFLEFDDKNKTRKSLASKPWAYAKNVIQNNFSHI